MEDDEQPNPQTHIILDAQEAVHWVQLRFLPECDTEQHIPSDRHAHEYDYSSVCYMVLIDIDFGKDIDQVMLDCLYQIQECIDEK